LVFRLRIQEPLGEQIHAIALRCQIQIDARRRSYSPDEQARLSDLFGTPERWGDTLRSLLWTNAVVMVPAFHDSVEVDVPVPCTYDLEVIAAKYLQALESGDVRLLFLFSGTLFASTETGYRVQPIPWDREAGFRMPVRVWRDMMDGYFPGCGWIRLRRETLDALQRFKASHALLTFEDAIDALIAEKGSAWCGAFSEPAEKKVPHQADPFLGERE
jgi:hypothetical protein